MIDSRRLFSGGFDESIETGVKFSLFLQREEDEE